jgi:hypothetical protein
MKQNTQNGIYWGADKSLARPGRKQARKHIRDVRDFNNIETWAVIMFFSLQGKVPKEIHTILTETLASFLPGWAKDLSAPLYITIRIHNLQYYSKAYKTYNHIYNDTQQNQKNMQECDTRNNS